jgi:hypothetical protein
LQPEKLYNVVNKKIARKEAKMKTLILIFGCLLLVIPSQAAEKNQADHSVQLNIQKERLQDICDIASRRRQDIENRYLAGLMQLKQQALQRARKIKLLDRMLWTEFISKSGRKPYSDIYFYNARTFILDDPKAFDELRGAMIDSYFLNTVADFLMDADARKLLADIVNSDTPRDSQNFLIRKEAQELLAVMDYFAVLSERLENQKASELTDLLIWEESSMAEVQRAIREMVSPPKETPYGTVIAVIYYNKDSLCMIEGIDEIIKLGDTINNAQTKNVKIVKIDIDRARVEFDGNGRQWVQAVGQSPNPGWK